MSLASSGRARSRMEEIIAFTPTLLPLPVEPPMRRCGIFARSATTGLPSMSLPSASVSRLAASLNTGASMTSRKAMSSRLGFGTSMPTRFLPGMRSMRTFSACSASARSSSMPRMRDSGMPGSGWNSKTVTTGPGWMPATAPLILNSASLAEICSRMCSSVAGSTRPWGWGGSKRRRGGSSEPSAVSVAATFAGRAGSGSRGVGSLMGRPGCTASRP